MPTENSISKSVTFTQDDLSKLGETLYKFLDEKIRNDLRIEGFYQCDSDHEAINNAMKTILEGAVELLKSGKSPDPITIKITCKKIPENKTLMGGR